MPGGSGPSAGAARLLFWVFGSCQVNLGYTRAKLLFGATYLLQLRRQFLALTLVLPPVELQNSRFGGVCSAPTRPTVISALK
jgi:hypothetical protein